MQHTLTTISTQSDINKVMQPHSAQNMYVSTGNNSSGNNRANPQTGGGGIFRGQQQQPSSSVNAPRGGGVSGGATRHVHVQPMYSQAALHQNMVLQPYTQYNPRQQTFPTSHLQYAPTPMPYYQYQYVPTLQQQPPPPQHTHPRSAAVSVNSNNNTLQAVQVQQQQQQQSGGNPGGGPGGTPSSQIQLLPSAVQGPGGNMGQVGVGVAPMVGVMPQSVVQPQPVQVQVQVQQSSRRRHQHRLPIIDPTTKKNILEDLDKSNSNTENELSNEQQAAATTAAAVITEAPPIRISQQDGSVGIHQHNLSNLPTLGSNDTRTNASPYNVTMEPLAIQRPDVVVQTPIVSAMSDAPSVEILPTPQKVRSKKIPIVPPKNVSESTSSASSSTTETEDVAGAKTKEQPIKDDQISPKIISLEQKPLVLHTQTITENVGLAVASPEEAVITLKTTTGEISSEENNFSKEELLAKNSQESEIKKSTEEEVTPEVLKDNSEASDPTISVNIIEEKKSLGKNPSEEEQSDETDQSSLSSMALKEVVPLLEEKPQAVESLEDSVKEDEEVAEGTLSTKKDSELDTKPDSLEKEKISSYFINYNEGQWSPSNPDGKKQYNREQLMQLREAKASRIQPEVKNVSILPQPNLMPSFIRNNNNNKRVQSMVGMIGNRETSVGNYMGKQLSMSGVQGQSQGSGGRNSSMKGMMIHVNLSLNQDVKLNENENAWRPRLLNKSSTTDNDSNLKATQEKDELVRRVRGILNKLTPERFDTLVEEIIKLKIDTPDKMDEVIVLVFEKAIDEPNFSVSYARLCHRLISEVKARDERMESGTKSNLAHFRNALLDKTEREFTQNVSQSTAKEKKLQPIVDKIRKCSDQNEKAELEAFLEEEERKIRRRSGGTVRFIGELFKISMLTGKIIYSCIDTLLNPHSEDMLECLCKLLTTVGAKFEQTPVNSKDPGRCYSLEKSIARMQAIASKTDKDGAKVSSRVRFMLQDVIDLRKNKWQTSRNEAPKTMGQIEKEAKNEQLTAQYFGNISGNTTPIGSSQSVGGSNKRDDRNINSRYGNETRSGSNYGGSHSQRGHHQQQNNSGGGGGGGGGGGSGGASNGGNNDDNTWHVQTSKGSRSQAVDSNKLEGLSKLSDQNLETKKMGGLTQFIWNNNTRQSSSSAAAAAPSSTPSNPFAVLSSLMDKNSSSSDRDNRDRDHNHDHRGPRNKGSYNKGSMERDRYDRGLNSRTGSSHGSRENSSSRQQGGSRSLMNSAVQKSASHSKYTQQQPSVRHNTSNKVQSSSSSNAERGIYRGGSSEQGSLPVATTATTIPQQSNRPAVAPPAVFQEASDADLKLIKSVVSEMIELADATKTVTPAVVACMKRIPEDRRCSFLYYILTDYLHLANVGKQYRRYLAITVAQLIQQNYISVEHFTLAYNEFSEYANDLIVDIPELWLYILQFTGPLIVKKILTVSDLWNKNLKDNSTSSVAKKFLKTYLIYCTQEVGPNFTRSMWTKFNLHWSDFMPENEVNDFIKSNRLEYVENESISPVIEHRSGESSEKHVKNVIEHIEHLLKEGTTADCIIDYSNGNITTVDKMFIRSLTESLSNFSILYKENSYKLETETFQKFCIPVLQRYIDSNEDHQLECLYAMQLLVHSLEHPRGLLSELFGELYDAYVIQKESLCKWRDSKDQSAGKGVAVKSLNPFFNSLFNDEAN